MNLTCREVYEYQFMCIFTRTSMACLFMNVHLETRVFRKKHVGFPFMAECRFRFRVVVCFLVFLRECGIGLGLGFRGSRLGVRVW